MEPHCGNCRWKMVRPWQNGKLRCALQRGKPRVKATDSCGNWEFKYKVSLVPENWPQPTSNDEWLVLADWFEEHGEELKANICRIKGGDL